MRTPAALLLASCAPGPAPPHPPADPAPTGTSVVPAEVVVTEAPTVTQPTIAAPLVRMVHVCTGSPTTATLRVDDSEEPFDVHGLAATCHDLPVMGLEPAHTYAMTLTLTLDSGEDELALELPAVTTDGLPVPFPTIELNVLDTQRTEPGVRFLAVQGDRSYVIGLDEEGEVVWLLLDQDALDLDLVGANHLLLDQATELLEVDLLGNELLRWTTTSSEPGQTGTALDLWFASHEVVWDQHGMFVLEPVVVRVPDYPTNYDAPTPTAADDVIDYRLVEVDAATGAVRWSHLLRDSVDLRRIGFNSLDVVFGGRDWVHANALQVLPGAERFLVSLRHQDAVVALDRAGEIDWILAPEANWSPALAALRLLPVGTPFVEPYHQHAPEFDPATGSLLLFDNGNGRSSPFTGVDPLPDSQAWSRLVEYHVDEVARTISQVWTFDLLDGQTIYSPAKGDIDRLPVTGNVLGTYANVTRVGGVPVQDLGRSAPSIRLVELAFDPAPVPVMDLEIYASTAVEESAWQAYRTEFASAPFPR